MCKFESSQKDESRWQSTDSPKAYRNTSALKCSSSQPQCCLHNRCSRIRALTTGATNPRGSNNELITLSKPRRVTDLFLRSTANSNMSLSKIQLTPSTFSVFWPSRSMLTAAVVLSSSGQPTRVCPWTAAW